MAVGTVDKSQGRQASVVFFTMTTSTAADMSRSGDFLFSGRSPPRAQPLVRSIIRDGSRAHSRWAQPATPISAWVTVATNG